MSAKHCLVLLISGLIGCAGETAAPDPPPEGGEVGRAEPQEHHQTTPASIEFLPEDDAFPEPAPDSDLVTKIENTADAALALGGSTSSGAATGSETDATERVSRTNLAWSSLVQVDQLTAEVQEALNRMESNLRRQNDYDRNLKEIRDQANLVGLFSGVFADYGEEGGVGRKLRGAALEIQDEALLVSESASSKGRKSFTQAKESYQSVREMFAQLKEGSAAGDQQLEPYDWVDVSDVDTVMRRAEASFKRMSGVLAKEDLFRLQKESWIHEASILATLSQIAGHIREKQDRFVGMSHEMRDAAVQGIEAGRENDYGAAKAAITAIDGSCKKCHEAYRFRKKNSF